MNVNQIMPLVSKMTSLHNEVHNKIKNSVKYSFSNIFSYSTSPSAIKLCRSNLLVQITKKFIRIICSSGGGYQFIEFACLFMDGEWFRTLPVCLRDLRRNIILFFRSYIYTKEHMTLFVRLFVSRWPNPE